VDAQAIEEGIQGRPGIHHREDHDHVDGGADQDGGDEGFKEDEQREVRIDHRQQSAGPPGQGEGDQQDEISGPARGLKHLFAFDRQ